MNERDLLLKRIAELQDEVRLLRAVSRAAGALLSKDDNIETIILRAQRGSYTRYIEAQAAYFKRFGKGV